MKQITFSAVLCLLPFLSINAQSKLDGATLTLAQFGTPATQNITSRSDAPTAYSFIVNTHPYALADEPDLEVNYLAEDVAIVTCTPETIVALSERDDVISVSLSTEVRPTMDKSLSSIHAAEAHSGIGGLDMPYDGTGVIVSLMDIGVDPNHRTFLNDDGSNRANRVWVYNSTAGSYKEYAGDEILDFTSDTYSETHGTHVLGIMTGSYKGTSTYAKVSSSILNTKVTLTDGNIPFYGVAPGAESLIGCGTLYNSNILSLVKNSVEYAREMGKPLVINLSLGLNTGPHDGTDSFSRSLASIAGDAIICISAGNEGDCAISFKKTFTEEDNIIRTFLDCTESSIAYKGVVDIWGGDSEPLDVKFVVYDTQEHEVMCELHTNSINHPSLSLGYSSSSEADKTFKKYFSGYVTMSQSLNSANNRVNIYFNASNVRPTTQNQSQRYRLGLIVSGNEGQRVNAYTESTSGFEFAGLNIDGWSNGDASESINAMACGPDVIAVGSYTTKNVFGSLDKTAYRTGSTLNQISAFSSYGTLPDGTTLPHITAPGDIITSSVSSYYVKSQGSANSMTAKVPGLVHDIDYYHSLLGTSMASPAVAGTIALWLQADPTLTREDILDIMKETASNDGRTAQAPEKFGYGKINALAGLKEIVARNGIADIENDPENNLVVENGDGYLNATLLGASSVKATLFSTSGIAVASVSSDCCDVTVDTSSLHAGVYILRVTSAGGAVSRRVLIR